MRRLASLLLLTLALSACAGSSPYAPGKSPANVPSHIDSINLTDIILPTNPSDGDKEVAAIAKRAIVSQLTNYGYTVVEGNKPADIGLKYSVDYTPEYGVFVHRSATIMAMVFDTNGTPLFSKTKSDNGQGGLISSLFTARDAMIADLASHVTIDTVDELRKGQLDNQPIAANQKGY